MANSSLPHLPELSPSQVRTSSSPAKEDVPRAESSCSTVASEFASQRDDDTDSEHDSLSSPREVCSNDVEWLLSCLTETQKGFLDRGAFHRECQRIFKNSDKDDNGFLDTEELEHVLEQLIPDSHRNLANAAGHRLVLSIKSALAAFDKDADRQLSATEFCEFVRFCYAWRSQHEIMTLNTSPLWSADAEGLGHRSQNELRPISAPGVSSENVWPSRTPSGAGYRMVRSLSAGSLAPTEDGCPLPSRGFAASLAQSFPSRCTSSSNSSKRRSPKEMSRGSSLARVPLRQSIASSSSSSRPAWRKLSPDPQIRNTSKRESSSRRPSIQVLMQPCASEPLLSNATNSKSASSRGRGSVRSAPSLSTSPAPQSLTPEPGSHSSLSPRSRAMSTTPRFGSRQVGKVASHEDLPVRQMQALKSLVRELAPSQKRLSALVHELLSKCLAPDGSAAFPLETQKHICEVVLQGVTTSSSPEDPGITLSASPSLATFFERMRHSATPLPAKKSLAELNEEQWFLEDRVIEVIAMLSLRWHAMKREESVPDMTDYAQKKWLPPAFSSLVGQILWRHRTAASLKRFEAEVESVRWVKASLDEDVVNDFNRVFKHFAASSGMFKVSQFRRIVDLLALNAELRPRLRRCDPVRACYGDIAGHSIHGMNKKQFQLMLIKTADLAAVHPSKMFEVLASHADALASSRNASKEPCK